MTSKKVLDTTIFAPQFTTDAKASALPLMEVGKISLRMSQVTEKYYNQFNLVYHA